MGVIIFRPHVRTTWSVSKQRNTGWEQWRLDSILFYNFSNVWFFCHSWEQAILELENIHEKHCSLSTVADTMELRLQPATCTTAAWLCLGNMFSASVSIIMKRIQENDSRIRKHHTINGTKGQCRCRQEETQHSWATYASGSKRFFLTSRKSDL